MGFGKMLLCSIIGNIVVILDMKKVICYYQLWRGGMIKYKRCLPIILFLILVVSLLSACTDSTNKDSSQCNTDSSQYLEGDVIEISSFANDPRTPFFCAGRINKEIPDDGEFLVEFSYGVLDPKRYDRKEQRYIEITAGNNNNDKKIFVKKITGKTFYTEEYACYYSDSGMLFNHKEIIKLPVSILEESEGWLIVKITAYALFDLNHVDGLDIIDVHYVKANQKIYFDIKGE